MRARTIVNSAGGRGHAMEPEEWRAQSIDGIDGMPLCVRLFFLLFFSNEILNSLLENEKKRNIIIMGVLVVYPHRNWIN